MPIRLKHFWISRNNLIFVFTMMKINALLMVSTNRAIGFILYVVLQSNLECLSVFSPFIQIYKIHDGKLNNFLLFCQPIFFCSKLSIWCNKLWCICCSILCSTCFFSIKKAYFSKYFSVNKKTNCLIQNKYFLSIHPFFSFLVWVVYLQTFFFYSKSIDKWKCTDFLIYFNFVTPKLLIWSKYDQGLILPSHLLLSISFKTKQNSSHLRFLFRCRNSDKRKSDWELCESGYIKKTIKTRQFNVKIYENTL